MQKLTGPLFLVLFFAVSAPFTSAQTVPSVTTGPTAGVNSQSAVLTGSVDPNGSPAVSWFEYGPSYGLGNRTANEDAGSGNLPVQMEESVSGLQPNTTYYYRLVAQGYGYGLVYGSIQTFVTGAGQGGVPPYAQPPAITVTLPTSLARTSVVLHARVAPNGSDTRVWFEYGRTSLGTRSDSTLLSGAQASVDVNFHLGLLAAGTTYHYRVVAENSRGVTRSAEHVFTTLGGAPAPAPAPQPAPQPQPSTSTLPGYNAVLSLGSAVSESEPTAGSEFDYTLSYRNQGQNAASQAVLRVTLPNELDFVLADAVPTVDNRNLSFDLGKVDANANRDLRVRLRVRSDANPGTQLVIPSLLTYRTPKNEERSAASNVTLQVRSAPAAAQPGGLHWYTWLLLFVILLIAIAAAYVFYRYGKAKRALQA